MQVAQAPRCFPATRPHGCSTYDRDEKRAQVGLEVRGFLEDAQVDGSAGLAKSLRPLGTSECACSEEAPAPLSAAWRRFLEAAEQDWVDVYQVAEHRSRYVGRSERAVTKMVRQMRAQQHIPEDLSGGSLASEDRQRPARGCEGPAAHGASCCTTEPAGARPSSSSASAVGAGGP